MVGFSIRNIYNRKNSIKQIFQGNLKSDKNDETLILTSHNKSLQITPDIVVRIKF